MTISEKELLETLQQAFPEAQIACLDLAGDNDHWEVTIADDSFNGKSRIAQHRMVQEVLQNYDIHALSIKTKRKA